MDSSSSEPQGSAEKAKLLNQQVDEVAGIMRENIAKAAARGENLDNLQNATDDLVAKAKVFKVKAKEARWKMWVKDKKILAIIILVVVILLVAILAPIINLLVHR
ncbi:synaptobrevin [Gonapodya prolifera JEL478]|uniref:Synaptobrevin n=1 Tax=Gonapodya prolifera (strain JEL478) TaxID=1344416 RepID=A0A139AQN4_GONPJ|nr:synaptobrevin [Gonapodya prolifera JEL478]|eukprot:KXS19071.1 synaptobrevin [Gonapodya prolifera JEL478]